MCVLHCGVHTACISSKLTANKNTLRTAKQGEHPAYCETRKTPCVLRNKKNTLRTAKQGKHPAYCETRRTPCVLRSKENTLRTAKQGEHPAYCETRITACVLRNLWSCVIGKASCFSKPMLMYIVFLFTISNSVVYFLALQALDSVGLTNSLRFIVSADSSIIISVRTSLVHSML